MKYPFVVLDGRVIFTVVAVSGGRWHSYRRTCFKELSSMSEDDSFTMCTIKHLTAVRGIIKNYVDFSVNL